MGKFLWMTAAQAGFQKKTNFPRGPYQGVLNG